MSKTKHRIKEMALELFNERGVESTTTRHIASAVGISQGNLHYHFSGRDVLIEALYADFKGELEKAKVFRGQEFILSDLRTSIEHHFELMWRYRFLLRDREVVWRRLPKVKRETGAYVRATKRRLLGLIGLMQAAGIMDKFTDAQHESFVEAQVAFLMGWIYAVDFSPLQGLGFAMHQAHVFMRLWTPMFVQKERVNWEKMMHE